MEPRVRPRAPMQDLVDRDVHPPRQRLPLGDGAEAPQPIHWTTWAALAFLAVFWLSLTAAGFLTAAFGWRGGVGPLAMAVASLVVAWLMGS